MEYRHLKCGNTECGKVLRIKITEKNYGQTVLIVCPKCGTKTRTTIPVPAKTKEGAQKPQTAEKAESFLDGLEVFGDLFSNKK